MGFSTCQLLSIAAIAQTSSALQVAVNGDRPAQPFLGPVARGAALAGLIMAAHGPLQAGAVESQPEKVAKLNELFDGCCPKDPAPCDFGLEKKQVENIEFEKIVDDRCLKKKFLATSYSKDLDDQAVRKNERNMRLLVSPPRCVWTAPGHVEKCSIAFQSLTRAKEQYKKPTEPGMDDDHSLAEDPEFQRDQEKVRTAMSRIERMEKLKESLPAQQRREFQRTIAQLKREIDQIVNLWKSRVDEQEVCAKDSAEKGAGEKPSREF